MNHNGIMQCVSEAEVMPMYHDTRFPATLYYRFLRALAQHLCPSLMVELGVCKGGGCLHMALGNPGGIVLGVDNANDWPGELGYVMNLCSNFVFLKDDSIGVLQHYPVEMASTGLLFIDTIHTYERTLQEFYAWRPYLAEHAVVCLDDLLIAEMAHAWDELPGDKVRVDRLHPGEVSTAGGFGIVYNIPFLKV